METQKEIFEHPCYKGMREYMKLTGLWPYTERSVKRTVRTIYFVTIISFSLPLFFRLVEEWGKSLEILLEIIGCLLYVGDTLWKYCGYIRAEKKMAFLYERIEYQLKVVTDPDERKVIESYAQAGKTNGSIYIFLLHAMFSGYMCLPLEPIVLDIVSPLNESRERIFPYYAEYFVDDQKYYYELAFHGFIACLLSCEVFCAFDPLYAQCAQHCCALFAIVEIRMRRAAEIGSSEDCLRNREPEIHKRMVEAIVMHQEAIMFVNIIEECFSTIYLMVIVINTLIISQSTVSAMMQLETAGAPQMMRFVLTTVAFTIHMYFNMLPGQKVIDHSLHIQTAAFHCEWYNTSHETKRLVQMVILRSITPCQFTCGQLCILNMENFMVMFKTSLSYITLVSSMR